MSLCKQKVEHLVADTNTFIKNSSLQDVATNVYTVQDVLDEITNKRQLRNLVVLPYNVVVKDVFTENVKFVTEFSKKTGDYTSLSATDIRVIALTYQLEKEVVGSDHLKQQPQFSCVINTAKKAPDDCTKLPGFYVPRKMDHNSLNESDDSTDSYIDERNYGGNEQITNISAALQEEESNLSKTKKHCENTVLTDCSRKQPQGSEERHTEDSKMSSSVTTENSCTETTDETNNYSKNSCGDSVEGQEHFHSWRDSHADGSEDSPGEEGYDTDDDDYDDDYDDDEADWITPENIEEIKRSTGGGDLESKPVSVACITSDFAMQNVLKQIGLNVLSIDGRLIRQTRTFVLRCYACFKRTSIMTKVFCPHCGNRTLKKVAVTLKEDGTQEIHINTRRPLSGKGKRFSIPRLRGGKHSNDPILCEDQPVPHQRPSRLACKKNDPLDPDYIAGYSPFVMRDITSKSAVLGIRNGNLKNYFRRSEVNKPKRRK
ncbi:RNA-binding protein NOB1 [Schistocerca nitens]|uniref:RNA-binding protein NOB1 n=1 Tax=Schistocerca nitens TaxID=7011 RepID=UPI002117EA69|nr:RNA-binding protein NOB1 [Schistocerca nitens]